MTDEDVKLVCKMLIVFMIVACVILSGCKSQPGADPVLTPQDIVTTPDEKKRNPCVKIENLPKCDGFYVIEYKNYITRCVWKASCMRMGFF